MDKALDKASRDAAASGEVSNLDWRRKISDHVAYALLVYTGLQIFMTVGALKSATGSILPYFALILLVAAIIPGCRLIERRWEVLSNSQAADPQYASLFKRDRLLIWIAAIGLPFVITALFKGIALVA
jgi:hypothetical protein